MKRRLSVWTTLLALAGCAPSIPPAPVIPAASAAPNPMLVNINVPSTGHDAAADAALNDLSDAEPDSRLVPEFGADEISWDIDVRTFASHPRVQYYLNHFQGVSRAGMQVFLTRGARYEPMIRSRFEAEGLPGDLGYLALIESGYSNDAVSRSHAVGMWQFMRGTGKGYGLRFEAEGLPGDLGYLALIESGYSNDAVSRSHAVGMWQFMRGTGKGYGLRI